MRPVVFAIAAAFALVFFSVPASASLQARISKSSQTMHVYVHGQLYYSWPCT